MKAVALIQSFGDRPERYCYIYVTVWDIVLSTVANPFFACIVLGFQLRNHPNIELPLRELHEVSFLVYLQILGIAVPTADENQLSISTTVLSCLVSGVVFIYFMSENRNDYHFS